MLRFQVSILLLAALLFPAFDAGAQTVSSDTARVLELACSSDTAVRRTATRTLAREYKKRWLGAESLPVLKERLLDADAETRMFAAMGLGGIASLTYISSHSADGKAFGRAIRVDFGTDKALLPALLKALDDRRPETREYAAIALGFAYPPDPLIEAALLRRWPKEKNQFSRRALLVAFGKAGYRSQKVLSLVRAAARKDPEPRVRQRAQETLVLLDAH